MFSLRPATSHDIEFLWQTQHRTLGEFIAAEFGTSSTEQRIFFNEHFNIGAHEIVVVVVEGEDAGFLSYAQRSDHLYLANVAVVPRFQRRGLGTAILEKVFDEADASDLPIRLQVLKPNPARQFYEERGFVLSDEADHHFRMMRRPHSPASSE